jgi:PEP-CTERM motif
MKKLTLIAGAAGLAAIVALTSMPVSANPQARDTMMTFQSKVSTPTAAPEPGTLALLALGIGSLGIARRRRR